MCTTRALKAHGTKIDRVDYTENKITLKSEITLIHPCPLGCAVVGSNTNVIHCAYAYNDPHQ
jgi:hypothetical protein